jgi:hypothetical protein
MQILPQQYPSRFISEEARRNAIVAVLHGIWKNIPSDIRIDRAATINDEFYSAIVVSCKAKDIPMFLQNICSKFGIRGLSDADGINEIIKMFNDYEFLSTIRNESQYLYLMLRNHRDNLKDGNNKGTLSLFSFEKDIIAANLPSAIFTKQIEEIPVISANSIRHSLRNLAMEFFFNFIEKENFEIAGYYKYFSGGNLNGSQEKIDINRSKNIVENCPPMGLFGSALGDRMLEGMLCVGNLIPCCKELKNGDVSIHELTEFIFGTRKDSAKDEKRYMLVDSIKQKNPQQMLYWQESIVIGCKLSLELRVKQLHKDMNLFYSCLLHTLEMFKNNDLVGAKSSVGHGSISFEIPYKDFELVGASSDFYIKYLETNKEKIKEAMKYE